jgi:sterol desaturase/sphingolipid hydroxylase (fatty acid hydroxylase superfamily)
MAELEIFKTVLFVGGFLLFSSFQYFFPYIKNKRKITQRTFTNISFLLLNLLVTAAFVDVVIRYGSTNSTIEHTFIYYIFAFLVLDIALYFWHRINHVFPFFWRFHQVHHLDDLLSTSTAFRFHPVEIFFSPLFKVVFIWLFGLPLEIIIVHTAIVNFFSMYEHSNFDLPRWAEKPIGLFFITPNMHKIHHHPTRKNTDSNYGTIFSFWDRFFGSFNNTKHDGKFGVGGAGTESHLKKLLIVPFQK